VTTDRDAARRLLRRSKDSERKMGRWLLKHDGPDPRFRPGGGLVTTTGRVGHITGLQFDTLSHTYAGENKNIKVWAGLWAFWKQIVDKAREQGKEPVLRIEPSNLDKAGYPVLHVITEERHAALLDLERQARESTPQTIGYSKAQQVRRKRR
jgi:hypothetical protein